MIIKENVSLLPYNTFKINVIAKRFSFFSGVEELQELPEFAKPSRERLLILAGGSNLLFTGDFDGLVLKNEVGGIDLVAEDEDYVYVRAGAGENWHRFVRYCLDRDWAGVENLSLIPGSVGAGPMQNIGAYGVEIREVFQELEAYHIREKKVYTFSLNDCEFGYRESVFKRKYRGQFVILNVVFRLRKRPVFNTQYGAIREELEKMGVGELSIQAISRAVIHIRSSKLPDPAVIGNAGSFFKNPEVSADKFTALREGFPGILGYPVNGEAGGSGKVKLAAGWLIEQCGWKGYRRGDAGCHAAQALVLVNYGKATGKEIYELSTEILQSVKDRFGVELEREVNIV
ncbi:MAG: UDP-N-acetylmuramate dehydrogenase [Puia sp.]|nr:UDP-N-acetylmuramate dehydrogenase [Puia sp.]